MEKIVTDMRENMKKLPWASALSLLCAAGLSVAAVSCQTLAPANNGGTPKDDTPSSKDDEPKKDDSGDVYVLDTADGEFIKNDGSRYSSRYFDKPVYTTPEWSNVPVLQSYISDYNSDYYGKNYEYEYVYMYPSKVLLYDSGYELFTATFNSQGLIESMSDDYTELNLQYDSDGRLEEIIETDSYGSTVDKSTYTFFYDSRSNLSKIEVMLDAPWYLTLEYSSTLSKTPYPLQILAPVSDLYDLFENIQGFVMSGLMGKPFSEYLVKSIKCTCPEEDYEADEEYSYVLDANGYVKEMTARRYQIPADNGYIATMSSSFEWKKL